MKIFGETVEENRILDEIKDYINKKYNLNLETQNYGEIYALDYWCIEDLDQFEKAVCLSEQEKINFLKFIEKKLMDRVVTCGLEYLEYLLDKFLQERTK